MSDSLYAVRFAHSRFASERWALLECEAELLAFGEWLRRKSGNPGFSWRSQIVPLGWLFP